MNTTKEPSNSANPRAAKLQMSSASSLLKNDSISVPPESKMCPSSQSLLIDVNGDLSKMEETFPSPSLVLPIKPPPPFAAYSFPFSHRRVTPIVAQSGGPQHSDIPPSSVDLLLSLKTKVDESTAQISTIASVSSVVKMATTDAATEPVPRSISEPSLNLCSDHPGGLFLVILYRMIGTVSQESDHDLMHWNAAGDKFWIDQGSPKLGVVLKRFFSHDRYQSLRRQLNSYGFRKVLHGPEKRYWCHAVLHRHSTFEETKACAPMKRSRGVCFLRNSRHKKRPANEVKAKVSVSDNPICSNAESLSSKDLKTPAVPQQNALKQAPVKRKATDTNQTSKKKLKAYSILKAPIPACDRVDINKKNFFGLTISSIIEAELLSMKKLGEDIFGNEGQQSSPNDDALSALATMTSFLPNSPTPFYSSGENGFTSSIPTTHSSPIITDSTDGVKLPWKSDDETTGRPIFDETGYVSKALLMIVHTERELLLVSNPIKATSTVNVDRSQVFDLDINDDNVVSGVLDLPSNMQRDLREHLNGADIANTTNRQRRYNHIDHNSSNESVDDLVQGDNIVDGFDFDKDAPQSPFLERPMRDNLSTEDSFRNLPTDSWSPQSQMHISPLPDGTVGGRPLAVTGVGNGTSAPSMPLPTQHENYGTSLGIGYAPTALGNPDLDGETMPLLYSPSIPPEITSFTDQRSDLGNELLLQNESEMYLTCSILAREFRERQIALLVTMMLEIPVLLTITGGSDAICDLIGTLCGMIRRGRYHFLQLGFLPLTCAIIGNVGSAMLQASTPKSSYKPWILCGKCASVCRGMEMGTVCGAIAYFASGNDVAFGFTIVIAQFVSIVAAGTKYTTDSRVRSGLLKTAIQDIVRRLAIVVLSYQVMLLLSSGEIDPSDRCFIWNATS